ncbi:aspartate kinase [Kwoniella mangroviensis CBS 10435]|uniref:aspartate kinase n=1 Tax=Kwoniella mangroviensis CBS 10435 TaxID=1331196 RepID=A0A1B9J0S0_9TREE|nr:aspartate kinase [Kwoniella mangroviensis CBS 10435]OCF77398.1 aspartate kinase [Kwoniella mangroviensis CBS 8886]
MSSGSTPTTATPEELYRNSSDGNFPWVVQKYGGTSVGKSLDSITKIVESYISNKTNVAIVCSARSSHTKALGTTNLLLQASREALAPPSRSSLSEKSGTTTPFFPKRVGSGFFGKDALSSSISSLTQLDLNNTRSSSPSPFTSSSNRSRTPPKSPTAQEDEANEEEEGFHKTVDLIKKGHLEAARNSLRAGPLRDELEEEIERDCESLRGFLYAAQIIDEISPRSQDSIVGTGERLACKIVAAALRDRGVDSELVVLDNIVDSSFAAVGGDAALTAAGDQGVAQLGQDFYDHLAVKLGERLRECGQRVPVVTGYFGPVPGSLLAQIGRGYTDLCAALCAVGLKASELQVWKEVDGIFTADPRKVKSARLVPIITPDEAAELTYYGSEVIHPFTMEQVIRARIPIRIKNVENPSGGGTIIYPDESFPRSLQTEKPPQAELTIEERMPTAVTIKDSIIVLNIHSNRKTLSHGFLARIFGTLDRAGVVVDLISTSEVHVSMAMQSFTHRHRLTRLLSDLEKIGDVSVSKEMAILSLVGRNMRNAIGSAGAMFTALAKAGVNIEMISQGASEINISCVIEEKDAIKALNVIHDSCLTYPPSPARFSEGLQLKA